MSAARQRVVTSADGTPICYRTVGSGEALIVVGGTMRTADDYLPLAAALSPHFEVHVVDRRGRGASGPRGSDYSVEKECEDIQAVVVATGATRLFGHSYGGLVALETAKRTKLISYLAVYEPGVSVGRPIPTRWMPRYRELLARGDRRGAFAWFVRESGHAPAIIGKLPLGCVKLVMRFAIRPPEWSRMEPLLEASLAEHQEVARLDGTVPSYGRIAAPALLLGGSKSPRASTVALEALDRTLPNATRELMDERAHNAPDETAPAVVADRLARFFLEASAGP